MINSIIFPVPPCSYTLSSHQGQLIHIPRKNSGTFTFGMYVPYPTPCPGTHLVIYAHPNAADIGEMFSELEYLSHRCQVHVLLYEYRGYGLCDGTPEEEEIDYDTESVYQFVLNEMKVPCGQVVFMGRSIGTGPTSKLCASAFARDNPPALLFLQAPFTSIKDCVKTLAKGYVSGLEDFASYFVADRFRTVDIIGDVVCPVVIQHGDLDEVVAYSHSVRLVEAAKSKGKLDVTLYTSTGYRHNNLDLVETCELLDSALSNLRKKQLAAAPSEGGQRGKSSAATRGTVVHLDRRWIAVPSLYEFWFPTSCLTLSQLEDHWRGTICLGHLLFQRHTLGRLWSLGIAHFIHKCARTSQKLDFFWRHEYERNVALYVSSRQQSGVKPGTPYKRTHSVRDVMQQCLAVWGSPLGLYFSAAVNAPAPPPRDLFSSPLQQNVSADAAENCAVTEPPTVTESPPHQRPAHKLFSALVSDPRDVSLGETPEHRCPLTLRGGGCSDSSAVITIREYEIPAEVLALIETCILAAPPLLVEHGDEGDTRAFVSGYTFDKISKCMQRVLAQMPDEEWQRLQSLLKSFGDVALSNCSQQLQQEASPHQNDRKANDTASNDEHDEEEEADDATNRKRGTSPLSVDFANTLRDCSSIPEIQVMLDTLSTTDPNNEISALVPWDYFLMRIRICAARDAFVKMMHANGSIALSADHAWAAAARVQAKFEEHAAEQFVKTLSRQSRRSAGGTAVLSATSSTSASTAAGGAQLAIAGPKRKKVSDSDCTIC